MSHPWHLFRSAIVLKVSGKDARRYLNSRLSNDLRSAQPGECVRAAALTAQGRVEALFAVFVQPSDTFYLACDGGPREDVAAALKRFIVADRVAVEDVSAHATFLHMACDPSDALSLLKGCGGELQQVGAIRRVSETGSDCLVLGASPERVSQDLSATCGEPLASDEYRLRRIKQGVPAFPDEVNSDTILTEAGLYDSVSFSKGCYVGQEVIERSDAIGKLPRTLELIRLAGSGRIEPGTSVENGSGEAIGKVVSSVVEAAETATFLFALLRSGKYGSAEPVRCAGLQGEIVPRQVAQQGT